jgi:hypothetical protein
LGWCWLVFDWFLVGWLALAPPAPIYIPFLANDMHPTSCLQQYGVTNASEKLRWARLDFSSLGHSLSLSSQLPHP